MTSLVLVFAVSSASVSNLSQTVLQLELQLRSEYELRGGVGGRGETERTESKSTLREMNLNVFSQMMNQNPGESMTNLCSSTFVIPSIAG